MAKLVGNGNVVGVAQQVVIAAVTVEEVTVIFNGFGIVGVGPEVVIDVNVPATIDFASPHGDGVTIVSALDPKQVVRVSGKG